MRRVRQLRREARAILSTALADDNHGNASIGLDSMKVARVRTSACTPAIYANRIDAPDRLGTSLMRIQLATRPAIPLRVGPSCARLFHSRSLPSVCVARQRRATDLRRTI